MVTISAALYVIAIILFVLDFFITPPKGSLTTAGLAFFAAGHLF